MISRTARSLPIAILLLVLWPSLAGSAPALRMGGEVHVNVSSLGQHTGPSVAVFPDGGFVVVWTVSPKDGPHSVIHARFFDKAGKPASGEFLLNDRVAAWQVADRVVADRDGSFLLVWTEGKSPTAFESDVFVRRFNRNGTPRGARFRANPPSASRRYGGVLAIGPDGRIAVAWTKDIDLPNDGSYSDAAARIFTAAGVPVTGELTVGYGDTGIGDDNDYAYPTGLALGSDGSLSALTQNYISPGDQETWFSRFPGNGKPSSFTQLNDYGSPYLSEGSWLTMDPKGGLLAVWSEYTVMAQRIAPNGAFLGKKILVSKAEPTQFQLYPVVAFLPGGFVVVWTDTDQRDGSGWGLYGRTFTNAGAPVSKDLQVNVTTAGYQYAPAIAAGAKGPVVVVWNQFTGQEWNENSGIFARILSPAIP